MGGTMSEPDWKVELRQWADVWVGGSERTIEGAVRALVPHIEEAEKRGRIIAQQALAPRVQALPGPALTPRQLEIARLTADGLTNREIAEKLHLTENSVKTHLRIVFGKTGTRSRGHLAALLVAKGHANPGRGE